LKQVLVTLLGLFGAPRSDSAPGELCPPWPPSLRLCSRHPVEIITELQSHGWSSIDCI